MISLKFVLAALMAASTALAHAEPSGPFANHHKEIARRQLEMNKRHVMARNCASAVAEYQQKRKARRALRRRGIPANGPIQLKANNPQNLGNQNGGNQNGGQGGQGHNGGQGHGGQGNGGHGNGGQPLPSGGGPSGGFTSFLGSTTPIATDTFATTSSEDSRSSITTAEDTSTTSSSDTLTSTAVETDVPDASSTEPTAIYTSATGTAAAAHYSTIQNFTCVTAPEVVEGPYYLRDDYVRQDIREDQAGTTLYLDIGVLDITSCQPVSESFVEIWSANAQGAYSAFGSGSTTGGGGAGGNSTAPSGTDSAPTGGIPTGAGNMTMSGTPTGTFGGPQPSGSGAPGGGAGAGGGASASKSNTFNFLRGGYTTDENGIVELTTIYPGFYSGRTVHIHTMVHQNISYHSNGTIISSSGSLRHIGQFYFDEDLNNEVLAQTAYTGSGQSRTYNDEDSIIDTANSSGYSAFIEIERLGDSLDDGLLGYITVGIDTSASYTIATSNYWDPDFVPAT